MTRQRRWVLPPLGEQPADTPRYVYDPDAPRYARLRIRHVGSPTLTVGITGSGTFAVVTDPSTPPHLVGHALDYADRLAELIPDQRAAGYIGKHQAPKPEA